VAVGVIIPVREPAPWLAEALESVRAQQPAPDDVVVVTDEAAAGPAATRAAGLARTDADLIALADADDVWEPGKLAAQLEALAAHPDAAACFGRATVVGADGRPTGERWEEPAPGLHTADSLRSLLFERNPIPAASVIVRRSALEAVDGFDGGPPLPAATDWDLWLRLVSAGYSFVCEPRARVRYRRHPGGVTGDVARLAEAGLAIHETHAELVDAELRRRVKASDLTSLARGRVRQRRYAEARDALSEAAALRAPGIRERLLRAALAAPGLRGALGRRDPYRGSA
jgi:GT2 family glycosyltransferase